MNYILRSFNTSNNTFVYYAGKKWAKDHKDFEWGGIPKKGTILTLLFARRLMKMDNRVTSDHWKNTIIPI